MAARDHQAEQLLRAVLAAPDKLGKLSERDWDLLLRQARASALVGRLAHVIEQYGLVDVVPATVWRHLAGEQRFAQRLAHDVRQEVERVAEPLRQAGVGVVLLKGAAYVMDDLPPAQGRNFSDIDILVPRADVAVAERFLKIAGWRSKELDRWDERFYRAWMHEVPPLIHRVRESVVDLHHTIVPQTARIRLDARLLLEAARPAALDPTIKVLAPADMVLHAATHLFNEGEFDRGLRDLADLDLLLRHFGQTPGFWSMLLRRADQLDLRQPAWYLLRYTARFLGTPVPAETLRQAMRFAPAMPSVMDRLFAAALTPPHPSCRGMQAHLALMMLYSRAHHLRLPLHLLIPHLLRKSFKRGAGVTQVDQPGVPNLNR